MRRRLGEGAEHLGTARLREKLFVADGGSYPALVRSGEEVEVGDWMRR